MLCGAGAHEGIQTELHHCSKHELLPYVLLFPNGNHSTLTINHVDVPRLYSSGISCPHSWPPNGTLTRGQSGCRMSPTLLHSLEDQVMQLLLLLMAQLAISL
jgi:hypothetical protein